MDGRKRRNSDGDFTSPKKMRVDVHISGSDEIDQSLTKSLITKVFDEVPSKIADVIHVYTLTVVSTNLFVRIGLDITNKYVKHMFEFLGSETILQSTHWRSNNDYTTALCYYYAAIFTNATERTLRGMHQKHERDINIKYETFISELLDGVTSVSCGDEVGTHSPSTIKQIIVFNCNDRSRRKLTKENIYNAVADPSYS